jgi:hypothetical protein
MSYELNGALGAFSILDVIQLLTMSQKVGELRLESEDGHETASLYLDKDNLIHAVYGELEGIQAFEALLGWKEGSFEFIPGRHPEKTTMDKAAFVTLLQAFARLDEMQKIQQDLPPEDINLYIVADIKTVPAITTKEWKVLALVNGKRTITRICRKFGDELTAKNLLLKLFKKKLISPDPPESDWRRLVPSLKPIAEKEGERFRPPRVRTNLLFKAIDGKSHFEDIRRKLDLSENDLLEDIKLLYELQWIKFNETDEEKFKNLLPDI